MMKWVWHTCCCRMDKWHKFTHTIFLINNVKIAHDGFGLCFIPGEFRMVFFPSHSQCIIRCISHLNECGTWTWRMCCHSSAAIVANVTLFNFNGTDNLTERRRERTAEKNSCLLQEISVDEIPKKRPFHKET